MILEINQLLPTKLYELCVVYKHTNCHPSSDDLDKFIIDSMSHPQWFHILEFYAKSGRFPSTDILSKMLLSLHLLRVDDLSGQIPKLLQLWHKYKFEFVFPPNFQHMS